MAQRQLLSQAQDDDLGNTPFAEDEPAEIAVRLQEISESIGENHDLTAYQLKAIELALDLTELAR
ncbi:MAG TPA: hypothetical protein VGI64_08090 [Streptosporangiaceae bacterium]